MPDTLQELSWIDLTAIAIVIVFFVLGLFRGLIWQVSRVATLVVAYVIAAWFGTGFGNWLATWFAPETAPELPHYIAYFIVFLVTLIAFGLLAGFLHRLVAKSPLSFYNRVGGGLLGVATGWLIVMTLLTGVQMAAETTGVGTSLAEAATSSRSRVLSDAVLEGTGSVLPEGWRGFTEEWRAMLGGDAVAEDGGEGTPYEFAPLDAGGTDKPDSANPGSRDGAGTEPESPGPGSGESPESGR